jgi:hypothetical protein
VIPEPAPDPVPEKSVSVVPDVPTEDWMEKLTTSYLRARAGAIAAYDTWIFLRTSKADPGAIRKAQDERDIMDASVRILKVHLKAAIPKFPGEHWPRIQRFPDGTTGLPMAGVWKVEKAELILPNGVRD